MKKPIVRHHASSALRNLALAAAGVALAGSAAAQQLPVINGLQCWFDASQGVTTAGSNVTGWADQSGNGYHATLGAGTPLLATNQVNGRPAIKFQGGNNYLNINYNIIPRQEYLVFQRLCSESFKALVMNILNQNAGQHQSDFFCWPGEALPNPTIGMAIPPKFVV